MMKYIKLFEAFSKDYMKKIDLKDFKKIKKGAKLMYMGGKVEVLDNDGYVLKLRGEDDRIFMVNKSQFDHGGMTMRESVVTEAVKEVVLSNEILDFLEERGILNGSDAQKVHKDLTAFLKEKGIKESVVTEAKNTTGLAFKEEQDYLDFKEFIAEQPRGDIRKDIGWDSKTKSWEVIMDVKVLDDIYGEGHPGNKESGWYGALPTDFESVIIEGFVSEAFIGPFVFNDTMSDEELKAMYDGALDGYAYWQKGFQYPKAKYKQAYQEIEKLLKKRGVNVDESVVIESSAKDGGDKSNGNSHHEDHTDNSIAQHWKDTYGEEFHSKYPAVAKIVKQRNIKDKRELKRIWDETYGENFEEQYPALYNKLD